MVDKNGGNSIVYKEKAIGPDVNGFNENCTVKCESGFHVVDSISDDQDMIVLPRVTFLTFQFLLRLLLKARSKEKLSQENHFLLFLFKLKLGISFSALGVLFGIDRTTASQIFKLLFMQKFDNVALERNREKYDARYSQRIVQCM